MKIAGVVIACIIGLIILAFVLEMGGLQWSKFFRPRWQNVEREVFEETKSYVHGVVQDIAKYYDEYNKADSLEDRQTIVNIIKIRFAEFEASKIQSEKLRFWFVGVRGY